MSRSCSRATAAILAAGPTMIGTMMPACAASMGPRREERSHGWATTVVAAGTCLALPSSRSYFELGGSPSGPIAATVPISLYFSVSMVIPPSRHPCAGASGGAGLELLWRLAKGQAGRAGLIEAEQP